LAPSRESYAGEIHEDHTVRDPLAPARSHMNEPSHGAKRDAEILQEEEEYIRQKDEKKQAAGK
jgi:hypothetical protein